MTERLTDIVAVPDQSGVPRWRAVAPRGAVAGTASLRPAISFGPGLPLAPGTVELSLYVEPEWRRRGIGSRLLAAARARAAIRARTAPPGLVVDVTAPPGLVVDVTAGSPGESFCRRHGFRHTGSGRHDLLAYCDVHQAWLGELIDAEPPGYRLRHWTGYLPPAPRVEELLRTPTSPGNAVLTAADADGDLAAYAVAVVGALSPPRARQYGPAVLPGHRGRRLGRWVNAALIRRLHEVHPHVDEIETATAENDTELLALREQLGFHPLRRVHHYELAPP